MLLQHRRKPRHTFPPFDLPLWIAAERRFSRPVRTIARRAQISAAQAAVILELIGGAK